MIMMVEFVLLKNNKENLRVFASAAAAAETKVFCQKRNAMQRYT